MAKYGHRPHNWFEDIVNRMGGEDGAEAFKRGELTLTPRDPKSLLVPVGEPITLPAVPKFVAKDAFTKANSFVYLSDNFKQFILPVVEENIPEAAVQVSELVRDSENLAIAAELKVHERGRLSVAHFFQAIQDRIAGIRTDAWWNAACVIGSDGETWAVDATLFSDGWYVDAYRLGNRRLGWLAGLRFLSR